jgi:hypothetical protein
MTPEGRQEVHDLCKQIADEKDPFVFDQLVQQLNELLTHSLDVAIKLRKPI